MLMAAEPPSVWYDSDGVAADRPFAEINYLRDGGWR